MPAIQLPDRGHAGPGMRAAVFLFRQPFLLWPAVVAGLGWFVYLLAIAIQNGRTSLNHIAIIVVLTPVLGFGVAVLTALPAWCIVRALGPAPAFPLDDGEEELLSYRANHFLGDEARGGKLRVTTRALTFVPHRLNVQLSPRRVLLDDIESVAWARVMGPAGTPLSYVVEVTTRRGTDTFVVNHAGRVADVVDRLRGADERRRRGIAQTEP